MRRTVGELGEGDAATIIVDAYDRVVLPGLRAASQFEPWDRTLAAEINRLENALRVAAG